MKNILSIIRNDPYYSPKNGYLWFKDKNRETSSKRTEYDIEKSVEKRKTTCLEKYGVDHTSKRKEYPIKVKQTCLEKYGVDHVSRLPGMHEKIMRFRFKDYTCPSGKVIQIQGYENKTLDILFSLGLDENSMSIREFFDLSDGRRYFADLFIPNENLIIETKSTYTLALTYAKNRQIMVEMSAKYNFQFIVFFSTKDMHPVSISSIEEFDTWYAAYKIKYSL